MAGSCQVSSMAAPLAHLLAVVQGGGREGKGAPMLFCIAQTALLSPCATPLPHSPPPMELFHVSMLPCDCQCYPQIKQTSSPVPRSTFILRIVVAAGDRGLSFPSLSAPGLPTAHTTPACLGPVYTTPAGPWIGPCCPYVSRSSL